MGLSRVLSKTAMISRLLGHLVHFNISFDHILSFLGANCCGPPIVVGSLLNFDRDFVIVFTSNSPPQEFFQLGGYAWIS
jgi:hypothetical protein